MASIVFQIPMTPITLNHSHGYGNGRRFKKPKTIKFEKEFNYYLASLGRLRKHIADNYNEYRYAIKIESFFYINEKSYFAKPKNKSVTKTISKTSIDLDNMQKSVNDLIFKWLDINDSQIVESISHKIPTDDLGTMVFRVTLVNYPELFLVSAQALSSVSGNTLQEPHHLS